jgi:hypothetical protein
MTTRTTTLTAAALLALAAGAHADIVSSANVDLRPSPTADVTEGARERSLVQAFFESAVVLGANLAVDQVATGPADVNNPATPGVIRDGALVESYLFRYDPIDNGQSQSLVASATFGSDILGVMFLETTLDASDPIVGAPGTVYPTDPAEAGFGLELTANGADFFEISADRRTLTFIPSANAAQDMIRVITAETVIPGLVHEYNFEDNGIDCVGGADAVAGASVEFRGGPGSDVPFALGRAYRMGWNENASDVFRVPGAGFFDPGYGDFTIAFALRRLQIDTGDIDFVIDARNSSGWDVTMPDGGTIQFRNFRGANVTFESPSLPFGSGNDEWHHLAFVYDRSETDGARWYFDGQLVSADDATAMIEPAIADLNNILIGGQSGGSESLDGQMGRLRIWNLALSTEQVQAVAAEGGFFNPADAPGPCAGDLDGDNDTDVFDFSILASNFNCGAE